MHIEKQSPKRFLSLACVVILLMAGIAFAGWSDHRSQMAAVQENPPGLLFSTVLDNITVNANGGWVKIGTNIVAVFLPENANGRMVLSDASGSEICHWDWSASRDRFNAPFQTVNFRNAMAPSGNQFNAANLKLTKPGQYVFDFYTSGKKFYTFPVSIRELKPTSAFGGEPRYLVDGDWNSWGYIYFADASLDSSVAWKLWLREWEYDARQRKIAVELVRDTGNLLVAENRNITSGTFRHDWIRQDFLLFKPKDKSLFMGRDLVAKDGGYTLTMRINDTVFGVWKITVKDGKLVTQGRAARGSADPLTFVEGAIDAFWYEKMK